jgi:hypothetical protein
VSTPAELLRTTPSPSVVPRLTAAVKPRPLVTPDTVRERAAGGNLAQQRRARAERDRAALERPPRKGAATPVAPAGRPLLAPRPVTWTQLRPADPPVPAPTPAPVKSAAVRPSTATLPTPAKGAEARPPAASPATAAPGAPTPSAAAPGAPGASAGPSVASTPLPTAPGSTAPGSTVPGPAPMPTASGGPPAPTGNTRGAPSPVVASCGAMHSTLLSQEMGVSIAQVAAQTVRQQGPLRQFFAQRRAQLTGIVGSVVEKVATVESFVTHALRSGVLAPVNLVQALLTGAFATAMALGQGLRAGLSAGVGAVTGTVRAVVGAVLDGIDSLAARIPILNLPGAGRVRALIASAVGAARAVVTGVVDAVLNAATSLVDRLTDLLLRAMETIGALVTGVVVRLATWVVGLVTRVIAMLRSAAARVVAMVLGIAATVRGLLARAEASVEQYLTEEYAEAVMDVVDTHRRATGTIQHLVEESADDADPQDPGAHDPKRRDPARLARDGVLVRAIRRVYRAGRATMRLVVARHRAHTGSLVAIAVGWAGRLARQVREVVRLTVSRIAVLIGAEVRNIVAKIRDVITRIRTQVTRMIDRFLAAVVGLVRTAITWVGTQVRSFLAFVRGLPARIVSAVRGLVSRAVAALTSGSWPEVDVAAMTTGTAAYGPATLEASAGAAVAIPAFWPLLAELGTLLAEIAAVIGAVELSVLLWWVAVILLVIAIVVLLVLAFQAYSDKEIERRIRDKEKQKDKTDDKPDPKKKPDDPPPPPPPPPRRRRRKPFFWDPKPQVAKAGSRGAIDAHVQVPRMHYEAHHCWPEYVGGAPDQPLMGARVSVHNYIHGGAGTGSLHDAMALVAHSEGFPQLFRDTAKNGPFIARLRTSKPARDRFAAALFGYYGGTLNAETDPPVPPPAYAPGIAFAYARL